ncbi:NUDIX hydrolase domain-like protein [Dendryphion nanum]|uniref:NAD(+) diphosphatase n=1 Tax=Dendryphion nanum TaxID=256645 RepID=A0A9P9ITU4_9PLEO|nr:NUDIX hydrolase domain-like protein [Dendryphion nanum]
MPLPQPELPEPAHPEIDSMLSRKFGKEVANYFSGSPLNRVSFLRPDYTFLSQALRHPSATFLLFNKLEPLIKSPSELVYASFNDVKPIIGNDPFGKTEEDLIKEYNSTLYVPQIIFLGLDERKEGFVYKEHYKGQPYFAVDVTPTKSVTEAAEALIKDFEAKGWSFFQGRMNTSLPASDAAIYAEARHLLDWNARNPYCGTCGYPTFSINGGFKRTCPPKDIANAIQNDGERPPCATRTGISNLSFPRTDPTVIMAVVSADGQRVLLGRQKRWPPYWYSTLAGFLEPAESVEEAVRREVWEESGIHLGRVVIHSTQPWPYPANLMIGAIGQAIPTGETIHLGHDAELEDAKWFTLDELREALRVGTSGLGEDAGKEYKEGGLRLPPKTAIANQLMSAVVNGFVTGSPNL